MRAAVYHNNQDVRIEELPRPQAGAGELLLRIEASGICGSDVMEWYRVKRAPVVLGHEIAGVVEEVGEGVDRFAAGDRVVATHHVPCGECHYCATDRHSVCETLHGTSYDPGGFCEYVRLPPINVRHGTFKLPDSVSFAAGSFVEPLACAVRALRINGFRPGHSVLVIGAGMSGVLQLQLARAQGAGTILASDISRHRLKGASRFGADVALKAGDDLPDRVREANGGRLADQVYVCTAALPAVRQAFDCVDKGGAVMLFAPVPPGTAMELPLHELWMRGIQLHHSYAGPPDDMRAALELIAEGRVDAEAMITHRLPLAETGEGFRLAVEAGESLKILIEPQR